MTREKAIEHAVKVAECLKQEFGATRVLLIGSTLDDEMFSPGHSDLDLYFEGIPYEREFQVASRVEGRFPAVDLDLVGAGHAPEYLRKDVEETGIEL